jgi:hypothetical protein
VNNRRPLLRIFLVWLFADVACLVIGMRWKWLLGIGVRGLPIDFLFGIIILGEYLNESGKL